MKKLLVALVTMTVAASAMADGHTNNMVRLYGWDGGDRSTSFDLSFDATTYVNGAEDAEGDAVENSNNRLALNYARTFGQFQVGVTYISDADSNGIDVTTGLSGYYNTATDLLNTCYYALHVDMMTTAEDDKTTTLTLEYGHRWGVANAWGLHLAYAPSVMLSQATTAYDADTAGDQVSSALAWNFLKFDVLF